MNNILLFAIWVTLIAILLQLSGGSIDPSLTTNVINQIDKIITSSPLLALLIIVGIVKLVPFVVSRLLKHFEKRPIISEIKES